MRGKVGVETERRSQPATYQRRGKVGETVIRVPTSKCRRHAFTVPSSGIGFKAEERVKRKRNRHPDPGETSRSRTLDGQAGALLGCSGETVIFREPWQHHHLSRTLSSPLP